MNRGAAALRLWVLSGLCCLPSPPPRTCEQDTQCEPGRHCRLSDGQCELDGPATLLCGSSTVNARSDRSNCGACGQRCTLCDEGHCLTTRGLVAAGHTALLLLGENNGQESPWRGWGAGGFGIVDVDGGAGSNIPFPGIREATTPVLVSRSVNARRPSELVLCQPHGEIHERSLCVVRSSVAQCGGSLLHFEAPGDASAYLRWRPVLTVSNVGALACAGRDVCAVGEVAGSLGERVLRCWTRWSGAAPMGIVRDEEGRPLGVVDSVSMGLDFACAIRRGEVYCWGIGGRFGSSDPYVAVRSPLEHPASQLATSDNFACAVVASSPPTVSCWGVDFRGSLGRCEGSNGAGDGGCASGAPQARWTTPAPVLRADTGAALQQALEVRAFGRTACARVVEANDGKVYCWGDALTGTGSGPVLRATRVNQSDGDSFGVSSNASLTNALAVGREFACAIRPDGVDVWCWGYASSGALGYVTASMPARRAPGVPVTFDRP